jgi:hypothetical protein
VARPDDPDRRLLSAVLYEGPWERAQAWLDAIDPRTGETRKDIRPGSLRSRLAGFCDRRNDAWRARWERRGTGPPPRWKRRTGHASP